MNMPRFTAEASLYKTNRLYQASRRLSNSPARIIDQVYAALMRENIEVFGCRPGFLQLGEGENMACIPDPSWAGGGGIGGTGGSGPSGGGGGGGRTGIPTTEIPCPRGLHRNPAYDPGICKECKGVCDTEHPLQPCEDSKIWCQAINAEAQRKRRECYEETCGWRCNTCI